MNFLNALTFPASSASSVAVRFSFVISTIEGMYPEDYIKELESKIEKVKRALRYTSPEDSFLIQVFTTTLENLEQTRANHKELYRLIRNTNRLN
ncbi:hypothetical protein [Flaviaesturariibacter amylovorans]|uniref:hypothetical protein n=1 Tax=Flaviaesturariibacter amylovorans TaxID=1084520 RepID=UPI0031F0D842